MMNLQEFVKSYTDDTYGDTKKFSWKRLPGDGSRRTFFRLTSSRDSFIVMVNPPVERSAERENISYLKIGRHLFSRGVPVARIHRYDLDHGWFILEDLGRESLQEIAMGPAGRLDIYKRVIGLLIRSQLDGREGFNPEWCYQTKRYDRLVMERFESDYFRTYFLRGFLGFKQDLSELQRSFEHLARRASLAESDFFMHRDFQSRNLIVNAGSIGILDWQGGRLGPLQYDLASLLIDPYVGLEEGEKEALYDHYLELLEGRLPGAAGSFTGHYPYLAIQRNLQILGAFSYLGKVQGKNGFLAYIPPALQSLEVLLEGRDDPELDPLKGLIERICASDVMAGGCGVEGW